MTIIRVIGITEAMIATTIMTVEIVIARVNDQSPNRNRGHPVSPLHPILAPVEAHEETKLGPDEEQVPIDWILLDNVDESIDIRALEVIPPKSKTSGILKWIIPAAIMVMFIAGFFYGGRDAGKDMIIWWIAANAILAGIGAAIAFAHPATIISSMLAAPLTSLNPMIAAGWVSGLVEAFSRKPKVKDLENLPEDILSVRGFWRNKVTRILLVVVFTNLGSSIGTFVAFPVIVKVFLGLSP